MISIVIVSVCLGISIWVIYTILSLAPWFPTRKADLQRIGDLSNLQPEETFYDIGSGDGRVIFTLAKRYPTCHFHGYEMSLFLFLYSAVKLKCTSLENASFYWKNGLKQDYSRASVVYVFATQKTLNAKPLRKVIDSLPSGSRLLSYNFHIKNWGGQMQKNKLKDKTPIYIYTKQ